jgi:glycosyltransferase involved in cell wall biosynthesis
MSPNLGKKLRVLFVSIGDINRASSRFRVYWWIPYLERKGIDCRIIPLFRSTPAGIKGPKLLGALYRRMAILFNIYPRIAEQSRWANLVIIQEALLPVLLLNRIRSSGARIIFDFSDPVHFIDNPHYPSPYRLLNRIYIPRRFQTTLELSECAIVENDVLLDIVQRYGCLGIVMKGPINTEFFKPRIANHARSYVNIGWTGSPRTFSYLDPILPVLDQLGKDCSNVRLTLVGAGHQPKLHHIPVQLVPWDLNSEPKVVADFDIGLFYLSDSAWNRARGGGKLFVYMAAGVPVVASPVGIGAQVVADGECGFLASTEREWYNALLRLIRDRTLRGRMAEDARRRAVELYSYEAYLPLMLSIIGYPDCEISSLKTV